MLIFKVDNAKAFDSVSWRYLDFMLCNLGFRLIWRSWIKACLESSRTSILVNGSPTSEFNVKRGLRQGDPLSSFLFIIIMEGLHMALSDSVRNGFIRGINISSSGINLSHLFFADDVIITTDWSTHDLENVIRIFKVFYLSSGLKINIHKSSIYGVAVSHEEVQLMASNTRCNAGFFPFSYIGLPIGSNMSLTANWKFLVDKFHSKLSSWNANLFSYGGLLTLLKEVLGSLGIYFLSLFKAPTTVLKTLETIRASFFWGGSLNSNKLSWMKWPHVLASFDKGGLAIGSLKAFNLALLHKWRWRFFVNPGSLWVKVIRALHGSEGGFDQNGCKFNGIWSTAHDGMFFVGALRRLINDHMLPSLVIKMTWDKTLPHKVNIFMWRLKLDRLPKIPEISCPSCNGNVESNVHIFFECSFTKDVWKTIRRWCGNSFPLFDSNTHWIEWLASWYGSQVKKKRLLVIIAATLWLIWRLGVVCCPNAYKVQYCRRDHGPSPFILLEVFASQDLWICHAFFGVSRPNNKINIIHQSPLFNVLKDGKAPEIPFVADGITYTWRYYFVDVIYPEWVTLVKSISNPADEDLKRIMYK
ncbi:putative RNA-directed DNA polymerase, eukaryota, reverse transcriptase zinc-binding domain protein [Tanacetum coccineum]